jgi:hypothetical protein
LRLYAREALRNEIPACPLVVRLCGSRAIGLRDWLHQFLAFAGGGPERTGAMSASCTNRATSNDDDAAIEAVSHFCSQVKAYQTNNGRSGESEDESHAACVSSAVEIPLIRAVQGATVAIDTCTVG